MGIDRWSMNRNQRSLCTGICSRLCTLDWDSPRNLALGATALIPQSQDFFDRCIAILSRGIATSLPCGREAASRPQLRRDAPAPITLNRNRDYFPLDSVITLPRNTHSSGSCMGEDAISCSVPQPQDGSSSVPEPQLTRTRQGRCCGCKRWLVLCWFKCSVSRRLILTASPT